MYNVIMVNCYNNSLIRRRTPLADMLPSGSSDAIDLASELLHFNPDKRMTARDALKHPFVIR